MGKTLFGGTTQQVAMGLVAALMFIMAVEASQLGFGGGFGFFGWDDSGSLGWHSATITESDGVTKVRVHQRGCKIQLEQRGEIEFSEEENDFARLGPDASFEMEVRGCGDKLEVSAVPGVGAPVVTARLAGGDAVWNEKTRSRFHDALLLVFDTTGYDAEGRVERLFRRGGAPAVLAAAEKISSDWAQRVYLAALLAKDGLSTDDTVKTWNVAGRSLGSDYELAQLISDAPERHLGEPSVAAALVAALRSIDSDYELRRSMDSLLGRGAMATPGTLDDLLTVASAKINSDYELAELLIALAEKLPAGAALPQHLDRAFDTVNSDYELRRALTAYAERPGLSRADLERLLQSASSGLSSDYELAEFLRAVANYQKGAEPWPPGLQKAIDGISSDHERQRAREAFE